MSDMIYVVSYDLGDPDRNYAGFRAILEGCGAFLPFQKSAGLLASSLSAAEIRDRVKQMMDVNDSLLVTDMTNVHWAGLNTRLSAWIEEHRSSHS